MGLNEHNDITAITILQQLDGVHGLQVNLDGNWVAVDPIPGALVIFLADQMQVIYNVCQLYKIQGAYMRLPANLIFPF